MFLVKVWSGSKVDSRCQQSTIASGPELETPPPGPICHVDEKDAFQKLTSQGIKPGLTNMGDTAPSGLLRGGGDRIVLVVWGADIFFGVMQFFSPKTNR